jgi:antitoxin MazE
MLRRARTTRPFRARLSRHAASRIFGSDTIPDVAMRAKLEKQGDTLALRITEGAEELAGLPDGAEVEITLEPQLDKAEKARRRALALEQMLEGVTPENRHGLIDYGPSVGQEAW